jgi:2-keto-4-pentenoate hydratase/2-oxohepta-3-ene-1,7-dioic acid hydratase in catechol pathway
MRSPFGIVSPHSFARSKNAQSLRHSLYYPQLASDHHQNWSVIVRYVTYTVGGHTRVGELIDDLIYPLDWHDNLLTLIRVGAAPQHSGASPLSAAAVKLEAPIIPGKIIAVGKNYAAHAKETGSEVPSAPLLFSKYPSAVIGNGDVITWRTTMTQEVDWEAELGVIIGARGKDIPQLEAYDYIFGYTVANDVSARDLQNRVDKQWTRAKGLDTFCPLGPSIVTRDEIADPHSLAVRTVVNGELMQDGNSAEMVYTIPMLVAYISQAFTLEPGDLILTGTPSGVGMGRTPPIFLKDGDEVSVSVEHIGMLTNRCHVITN